MVEYRIPADTGKRDHRNAVVVPIDSIDLTDLKKVIRALYTELSKLPNLGGRVEDFTL